MNIHMRLAELATLGATAGGIDRGLFTPAEHAARQRFADWAREAGFDVSQDRTGNVFARLNGRRAGAPIACGSHLDTVKAGGAYDGALGVIGGLEALERIAAAGTPTERALEVVAWAGEEGSRFPLGCLGSSAYCGLTPPATLDRLVDADGIAFRAALDGPAGLLSGVRLRDESPPPAAYVELHIEQGPVLEDTGARLGIVSAIAGQRRFAVTVQGEAGHAGTLPMPARTDALCAAAEFVLAVERAACDVAGAVATTGWLVVEPNQTNTVPGRVQLRVDARSVNDDDVAAIERAMRAAAGDIERARRVAIAIELIERRPAVPMDCRLRALVGDVCRGFDARAMDVPSGAGHDAMCLAHVAPTAMIFVPSIGGQSHVAAEATAPADLELGIEALGAALLAADRDLARS